MRVLRNSLLTILIVVSLGLGSATLTRGHDWGDDFAWYILQTKSLLSGTMTKFMEQSAFTNTQSTTYVGPLAYPWGYPLILAPAYALKGINPLALKLPGLFFYALFLLCFYYLIKPRLTRTESLIAVALFAFNPLLLQFLNQLLSDIPFLFFSTLTLLLMTQNDRHTVLQSALIGLAVFLTAFLRATGIFLLASFLLVEFFRLLANRQDRNIVNQIILNSFVACAVFALLYVVNLLVFPSGGESYLAQFAALSVATVKSMMEAYFQVFSLFFGAASGWSYLYYFTLIFFLIGAWNRRKAEPLFIVFFIVWLIVHITYPYWQGPRYIFPLLPIYIYFTFQGMKAAINKIATPYQQIGQRTFYAFWIVLAGVFLYTSGVAAYDNLRVDRYVNGPFDPYSKEVYNFINENTPPDSVIVFFKPRVMILMTGHNTIMSMDCEHIVRGDYLVLNKKVGANQQITPEDIDKCNLPLTAAFENRRFIIYQVPN